MGLRARLDAVLAVFSAAEAAANGPWIQQEFTVLPNNTYIFNLELGTPPQQVSVDLDYGSGDLRVNSGLNPCAEGCDPDGYYNAFDTFNSSTYRSNQSFSSGVRASDGSSTAQAWGWDNVQLADTNLSDLVIAVALPFEISPLAAQSSSHIGERNLLGLGPRGSEACVISVEDGYAFPTYDNLLYHLKRKNITRSASFSVWVDPESKSTGKLLLGAADENLYQGAPHTVPILNFPNSFEAMKEPLYIGIPLGGLRLYLDEETTVPAFNSTLLFSQTLGILDSRLNFSLPQQWLATLGTAINAVWSERLALYVVRCDLKGSIGFLMSEENQDFYLQAPLQDFISPAPGITDALGNPACVLEVQLSSEVYLSNKFLQNYYIKVDYESREVTFADPAKGTGQAEIEPMTATSTFSNQRSLESYLGSDILTLLLTETAPPFSLASSVSQKYLLGGEPEPTRVTGSAQINSKNIPKATEASNAAGKQSICSGFLLSLLMLL